MEHSGPQPLPAHLNHSPRSCFQPGLPLGIGGHYLLSEAAPPVLLQGPPPSLDPTGMPVFPAFQCIWDRVFCSLVTIVFTCGSISFI